MKKKTIFATFDPFLNEVEQLHLKNMPGILAFQNKNKMLKNKKEFELFSFETSEMLSSMTNYTKVEYINKYYNEDEKEVMAQERPIKSEDAGDDAGMENDKENINKNKPNPDDNLEDIDEEQILHNKELEEKNKHPIDDL